MGAFFPGIYASLPPELQALLDVQSEVFKNNVLTLIHNQQAYRLGQMPTEEDYAPIPLPMTPGWVLPVKKMNALYIKEILLRRNFQLCPTPQEAPARESWYRIGAPIGQHLVVVHEDGSLSFRHETYKELGLELRNVSFTRSVDVETFLDKIGW